MMQNPDNAAKGRDLLAVLFAFSFALVLGGVIAAAVKGEMSDLIPGLIRINVNPSQFTRDYFELGTLGGAFLNAGLVGLMCCLLLLLSGADCTGTSVAGYWLCTGFSTFGMNVANIWPFFLGVFVYSRIRKVPFRSVANMAMFSAAVAPFASELMFRYPNAEPSGFSFTGFLLAIAFGIIVGCIMPPLCAYMPKIHQGYDLYNAGPAAGFVAFLTYCILFRSPGVPTPENTSLGDGEKAYVNVFFLIVFLLCILWGWHKDKNSIKNYARLWRSSGHNMDYVEKFGFATTMINFGVYGLFILLYYNVVHGIVWEGGSVTLVPAAFTGATMGAIMCMYTFVAHGAQPRTVFPIAVGYLIASLLPFAFAAAGITETQNWNLCTQGILVGMCFASGLAPVSGKYGFWAGVAAGAIHATIVMSVPLWHGGFCLYNGGFTDAIVAVLLIPVLDHYFPKLLRKEEE